MLTKEWKAFTYTIVSPWALVSAAAAGLFGWVLTLQSDSGAIAIMTLGVSLVSGTAGGILTTRWSRLNEERVIEARGTTAVRSLKLLLQAVASLVSRVRRYQIRQTEETLNPLVMEIYFEEVIDRCSQLQENTMSAIENWTDIVPEANIKTQIGEITGLYEEVYKQSNELAQLREKAAQTQGGEKIAEPLRAEVLVKEGELSNLRRELERSRTSIGVGSSILSFRDFYESIRVSTRTGAFRQWPYQQQQDLLGPLATDEQEDEPQRDESEENESVGTP